MLTLLAVAALLGLLLIAAAMAREARRPPRRTAAWAIANGRPADPADLGLAAVEWRLDRPGAPGGLAVWDVELPGDEDGACLVLVHGWGRSRVDSLTRLEALVAAAPERFRRALLLDLRGHGDSPGASTLGDGDEGDVLELLRRAEEPRVLLAGHSMGAVSAILAAAGDDPVAERVAGIVAWAPYRDLAEPMVNRLRARGWPTRPFTDLALLLLRLRGVRRRSTVEAAARLRVPLLVVHGVDDPISTQASAEAIASAAPRGRLALLPGGHADVHEREVERHAEAVRGLVKEVEGETGIRIQESGGVATRRPES